MKAEKIVENLVELSRKLEASTDMLTTADVQAQKEAVQEATGAIGESWCGSFIGYHSRTYLQGFRRATGQDFFDREWGINIDGICSQTTPGWGVYTESDVIELIGKMSGCNVSGLEKLGKQANDNVRRLQGQLCAILSALVRGQDDEYLNGLKDRAENMLIWRDTGTVANALMPRGQFMSRDSAAMTEGIRIPPHLIVDAQIVSAFMPVAGANALAEIARQAADYLQIRDHLEVEERTLGEKVFIGHGRSLAWMPLKDFLTNRLHLEHEEFNREPVAGITTSERLTSMLQDCGFAFLVLTAEDEAADGSVRARENVVHEVGLFQGRYGFRKAIVLLENGCNEFSNIHGLGQIRFDKGKIEGAFEEIRRVLEREGIIKA